MINAFYRMLEALGLLLMGILLLFLLIPVLIYSLIDRQHALFFEEALIKAYLHNFKLFTISLSNKGKPVAEVLTSSHYPVTELPIDVKHYGLSHFGNSIKSFAHKDVMTFVGVVALPYMLGAYWLLGIVVFQSYLTYLMLFIAVCHFARCMFNIPEMNYIASESRKVNIPDDYYEVLVAEARDLMATIHIYGIRSAIFGVLAFIIGFLL